MTLGYLSLIKSVRINDFALVLFNNRCAIQLLHPLLFGSLDLADRFQFKVNLVLIGSAPIEHHDLIMVVNFQSVIQIPTTLVFFFLIFTILVIYYEGAAHFLLIERLGMKTLLGGLMGG